jgi:hypothetical protein
MPNVVIRLCCSQKIEEKEKSVKVAIYRAALPTWRAPPRG